MTTFSPLDRSRTLGLGLFSGLFLGLVLLAGVARAESDKPGGSDHPLLSRYAGSTLYTYGDQNDASVPVLVAVQGKPVQQALEGRIANRLYFGPKGSSPLEVFRNYQAALSEAGFVMLYQCEAAQCQRDKTQEKMVRWVQGAHWVGQGSSDYYVIRIFEYKPEFHYLHARKAGAGGNVDVQVALRAGDADDRRIEGRALQFVQVIEAASVAQRQVTVDAAAIGGALKRDGRIALYGILFDSGEARIKSGSADTLAQMAAALKNEPALNVYIVGHTDNQGALAANLGLAQRRAQAVAEALSATYGIAPARLLAHGVASLAPVATNADEAGRAKNRRVEMVLR